MGEPLMRIYCDGFLPAPLRKARVTDEVRAAVRPVGVASLDNVQAVVLETDGSRSVVRPGDGGNGASLVGVDESRAVRPCLRTTSLSFIRRPLGRWRPPAMCATALTGPRPAP